MSRKTTVVTSFAILLAGGVLTATIFLTEPGAERTGAVRETAMLVDVTGVEHGTFRPVLRTVGTVEAAEDISLSPRVGGQIVGVSENFTPGGFVEEGEVLVEIDPADYRNAVEQRRSDLRQAESDLAMEQGRQRVAERDYELLGDTLGPLDPSLVLREPQIEAARARVRAARAALEQAELELERTAVRAPFDAHVLTREANVGSQVDETTRLGRIVGLDTYWVVATVPQGQLRRLSFPGDGEGEPSPVRIRNRTAWDEGRFRTGTLHRLVGALEAETRLARILVDVPDPLARESTDSETPRLLVGSFVEARIEGRPLTDVVRLDRDYLREDGTVWVMEDGALAIRDVDVVFEDAEYAYLAAGLEEDARVVTTNLSTVVEGAPLRLEGASPDTTATPGVQGAADSTPAPATDGGR